MPLEDALVESPNGPETWAALLTELAAELREVESGTAASHPQDAAELDDVGVPWVPRPAARFRSALSLSRRPARDGGTGHATRAAPKYAWRFWAQRRAAAGGWPRCSRRSPTAHGRA